MELSQLLLSLFIASLKHQFNVHFFWSFQLYWVWRQSILWKVNMILIEELLNDVLVLSQLSMSISFLFNEFSSPRLQYLFLKINIEIIEKSLSLDVFIVRNVSFEVIESRIVNSNKFWLDDWSCVCHFWVHIAELIVHFAFFFYFSWKFMLGLFFTNNWKIILENRLSFWQLSFIPWS